MIQYTEKDGSLIFSVRVAPRASKSEIIGEMGGALKVKINAPPTGGAANAELIKILAKFFAVSRSAVEILKGQTCRQKQVRISGISGADLLKLIERAVNNPAQKPVAEPQKTNGS